MEQHKTNWANVMNELDKKFKLLKRRESDKKYRQTHKEQIKKKGEIYYKENKEKCLKTAKIWRENNVEKVIEYRQMKWYCEICNCEMTRKHKYRHIYTRKHIKNIRPLLD